MVDFRNVHDKDDQMIEFDVLNLSDLNRNSRSVFIQIDSWILPDLRYIKLSSLVLHSANESPSNNGRSNLFGKHKVYREELVYFFCLHIRSLISYNGNVGSTRSKIF